LSQTDDTQIPMVLNSIGWIKNDIKETGMRDWNQIVSELVFDPGLQEALDGLEEFSHLVVLFWMHRSPVKESFTLKTHPQRREDLPLVGVFATRSPVRPNPLGMTVVKLLERKDNVLKVIGLDAIDSTPVIDVKPYLPSDSVTQMQVPDWVHKLRKFTSK